MWLFEPMPTASAVRTLVLCGGAAVMWSSLVGFMMLIPLQPWGQRILPKFNFKQVGAAHLDWIVLGLMLGLAAGVVSACGLTPARAVVVALAAGAWLNPLPYVFRAFGVNAFALAGPPHQIMAAGLGLVSSLCIFGGWFSLLSGAWAAG